MADESIENDYDENPQEDFETQNQEIVELPEYPMKMILKEKQKLRYPNLNRCSTIRILMKNHRCMNLLQVLRIQRR